MGIVSTDTDVKYRGITFEGYDQRITDVIQVVDYMEYATDGDAQSTYTASTSGNLIQSYSESVSGSQGLYCLKTVATTGALNETLTKTLSGGNILDLTDKTIIRFDIMSSRTGANLQIQITDTGLTNSTYDITILNVGVFETKEWDISDVANVDKDAIDTIIFKIINADVDTTFYIDNVEALKIIQAEGDTVVTSGGNILVYNDEGNWDEWYTV